MSAALPVETVKDLKERLEDAMALADSLELPVVAIWIAQAIDHVPAIDCR